MQFTFLTRYIALQKLTREIKGNLASQQFSLCSSNSIVRQQCIVGNKVSPGTVPFEESIKAKHSHNQRAWVGRANQTNGSWRPPIGTPGTPCRP